MNILGICGSPRGNKSQTKVLAEKVLEAAKTRGAKVEMIDLSEAQMKFCRACEACHEGPDCVHNDDTRQILDKMLAADGIVLATPVYLSQVTAQLKAVLDRSSHFIHCLRLMGKYVASVATSGGGNATEMHAFLKNYAFSVGAQFVGSVDAAIPLKNADLAAASALGESLFSAVREGIVYPEQAQIIETKKRYFARIIAMRKDQWPYEYEYWKQKGWL